MEAERAVCGGGAHHQALRRESVKPKKMHEIVQLSALTNTVLVATECDQIVDVGSGLGFCAIGASYRPMLYVADYPARPYLIHLFFTLTRTSPHFTFIACLSLSHA